MKKILSILALTSVLLLTMSPVMAGNNGCNNRCGDTNNTTNNKGGKGGDGGTGIGVGIGKGGDASSKSKSSSSSSSSSSVQGTQLQGQIGINKVIDSGNATQGQVGIVKNVGPQVVVTDKSVTTYEAQDRDPVNSAYSHASHRYECVVGVGGGVQAANLGVSISGGYESSVCNMGFVAKFLKAGDPRLEGLIDAMVDAVMPAPAVDATTYTVRD